MPNDLDTAINALPPTVADFFRDLRDHADYSCAALTMQMTIHFRGSKVGGLNRTISEWYVSKVFVRDFGGATPLENRGFRRIVKNETHEYWALSGPDAMLSFREAISEMTGVNI